MLVADNSTSGYFGVTLTMSMKSGLPRPYQARVTCAGKQVVLRYFATAEEAALYIARSREGQALAAERAAAAAPLTSEEARQQAQAQRLTLRLADNKTGFLNVFHKNAGKPKPLDARVSRRGGSNVLRSLGTFVTAEEAALRVARSPEGQAAMEEAAAAQPMTSKEARQLAQAEKLTLRVADNGTGYLCVSHKHPGQPRPYLAQVSRNGRMASLSCFATAEEAALCVARSPEGQAAAERAAAASPPLASEVGCGEEGEEEVEVLDAVEVHDDDDYDDDESLLLEAEGVVGRKRARESTRLGDENEVSR